MAKPTRTIEELKEAIAKLDEYGVVCSDGTLEARSKSAPKAKPAKSA
ncbi:MAG: hypothetical protein RLZZ511_4276 [Cyanobacteriota bacterium]|jgi:hypothetical protein